MSKHNKREYFILEFLFRLSITQTAVLRKVSVCISCFANNNNKVEKAIFNL